MITSATVGGNSNPILARKGEYVVSRAAVQSQEALDMLNEGGVDYGDTEGTDSESQERSEGQEDAEA